jgi:hypothetical protein
MSQLTIEFASCHLESRFIYCFMASPHSLPFVSAVCAVHLSSGVHSSLSYLYVLLVKFHQSRSLSPSVQSTLARGRQNVTIMVGVWQRFQRVVAESLLRHCVPAVRRQDVVPVTSFAAVVAAGRWRPTSPEGPGWLGCLRLNVVAVVLLIVCTVTHQILVVCFVVVNDVHGGDLQRAHNKRMSFGLPHGTFLIPRRTCRSPTPRGVGRASRDTVAYQRP